MKTKSSFKYNKLIYAILLICISIVCLNSFKLCAGALDTEIMAPAKAMVVLEGNSNEILYSYNCYEQLPMASTTKIATAIYAIEHTDNLDERFVVSDKAIGIEGTSMYLKSGEEVSMRELLYGLMLASGNDSAVAIAERLGGEETFVANLNDFACNTLGLTNTHFDNPHGLDSETHYTSAYDLARISSYALKNPTFKEIASTQRMVIPETNLYQARYLKHKNKLLFSDEHCIGVKTGFTDNAGRCLVHAHEENGMTLISVVLNCQPMFEECERLTNLALNNYTMKQFVEPYTFVSNIGITSSAKNEIGVITVEGYSKPILKSEENDYEIKYILPDDIVAPVELNQVVGSVQVLYKGDIIYTGNLITIEAADNNDLKYLMDNIIDKWF